MSYLYDVFISYPHEEKHRMWVHDIFLAEFKLRLNNSLHRGTPPEIYVDKERNTPGVAWPKMVRQAMTSSRIIIPIWSIDYFQSSWCRKECAVMFYREHQLEYRTLKNPYGLIVPVRLFDSEGYPPLAKEIQQLDLDCNDYNGIFEGYKRTEPYVKLMGLIGQWANSVAECIRRAPPWNPDWMTNEWIDEAIKEFEAKLEIKEEPFDLGPMG